MIVGYLLLIIAVGFYFKKFSSNTDDYFRGGCKAVHEANALGLSYRQAQRPQPILRQALYRAFDGWYDLTVLRRYHFANAWNGLNIRSVPSLYLAIVGKLTYGAGLGIISLEEG